MAGERKTEVIGLLMSIERVGMENLVDYMTNEGDFFTAPCSTRFHLNGIGGLAEHSLNVLKQMRIWSNDEIKRDNSISNENIIIVSLLHDLGKAYYRGKPNYIPNILKSGKISEAKPFEINKDRLCVPHEVVSLQIATKYIELTEDEEFAILYHNGLYVPSGRDLNGNERPLQTLLHHADLWVSRFVEKEME